MARERRLVYRPEVVERSGRSYPWIWTAMRAGRFPRSVVVGGNVAWYAHEFEAWLAALPRSKLKGDPDYTPDPKKCRSRGRYRRGAKPRADRPAP